MDERVTLAALRVRMGHKQSMAAQYMGLSTETLRKWETDSSNIPLKLMQGFANFYCYPLDKIFFGDSIAFSEELRRKAADEGNEYYT